MATAADSVPQTAPSPATLFEAYLQLLSESYITFFQERQKVEKQYVAALTDLLERSKELSTIANNRLKTLPNTLSTTRAAWDDIINNLKQETDARILFLASLSKEIIPSLVALRDSHQEAFRGRQQDLEAVVEAHVSYVEGPLPALKRTYIKKSLELEELRETRGTSQLSPTEPQTPSLSLPQQAGHLKQLITFVDKNGHTKESPSGATDVALLSMQAKREVDGADREYREGIRRSEGLRRARLAVVENICTTANGFAYKLAATMRTVLGQYLSASAATGTTLSKICHSAWATAKNIDVTKDTGIPQDLIAKFMLMPRPCYYFNYEVGECRDLIFGTSLVDYANTKALSEGAMPKIVHICIQEVEKRGYDVEGIYQVSARHAEVRLLQYRMERNEEAFNFAAQDDNIYTVSSLLKLYLSELPEPLFPLSLAERMAHASTLDRMRKANARGAENADALKAKIQQLPAVHRATLGALFEHLRKVNSRSPWNKMDHTKLAAVFSPLVFGDEQLPTGKAQTGTQPGSDTLLENLIIYAQTIFPMQPPQQQHTQPQRLMHAELMLPQQRLPRDQPRAQSKYAHEDSERGKSLSPPPQQSAHDIALPRTRGPLPPLPGPNPPTRWTDADPPSRQSKWDDQSYSQKGRELSISPAQRLLPYLTAPVDVRNGLTPSHSSSDEALERAIMEDMREFEEGLELDMTTSDDSALGDSRLLVLEMLDRQSEESWHSASNKEPMPGAHTTAGKDIAGGRGLLPSAGFADTPPISRIPGSQGHVGVGVSEQLVMLRVSVLDARSLSHNDTRPYVTVRIGSEERRTKPAKSPNPRWQETFAFSVIKGQSPILVQMFDYRLLSKDRLLGSANVDVWQHLLSAASAEIECKLHHGWSTVRLKLILTCEA